MESTNLHLHHQIEGSDSSQVQTSSSCFSVGSNDHASSHWKSSNLLVESSNNIHASGCEDQDPNNNPMVQELSFVNWPNNAINPSSFPHLIPNIKIKQESLASNHHHNFDNYSSFQKLSDLLKNPSSTNSSSPSDDQMLLLKTHMLTNDYHHNNSNFPSLLDPNKELITNFSHIFPSVNISNLINDDDSSSNNMVSSFSLSSNSSTLEMNNLPGGSNNRFGSAKFVSEGSEINPPSPSSHLIELVNGSSTFDADHKHRQHSSDLKLWNSTNNLLSINNNNGVQETKRSSCIVEPNKSTMPKKARFEASCPPLKVRKEKLGDRIAALQQLVAPFGKTDTASVLMEAIGYIKFLQNQVETLSVPYMKLSSRNKTNNITERVLDDQNRDDDEPKQDLRSRGLCLVPVSCMSYLASDASNGGVWLPSNFNPTI